MADSTQKIEQLRELIGDIKFAMFSTIGGDGVIRSRPMTTQNADPEDPDSGQRLWFFMSRTSDTANDLRTSSFANLSYAHPGKDAYVSVSGEARLVDDPAIKRRLWSKMNEAWFPAGVEDADLALVCVDVLEAEYWDVKESKLTQVAKMMKASITDKRPTNLGDHEKIAP